MFKALECVFFHMLINPTKQEQAEIYLSKYSFAKMKFLLSSLCALQMTSLKGKKAELGH